MFENKRGDTKGEAAVAHGPTLSPGRGSSLRRLRA